MSVNLLSVRIRIEMAEVDSVMKHDDAIDSLSANQSDRAFDQADRTDQPGGIASDFKSSGPCWCVPLACGLEDEGQLDHLVMKFAQARPVPDTDKRDRLANEPRVQALFRVIIERAGSLVEDRKTRAVEQKPREGQPLLLPARQHVRPMDLCVEAAELLGQMREIDFAQHFNQ
jgi:hypothetical protein